MFIYFNSSRYLFVIDVKIVLFPLAFKADINFQSFPGHLIQLIYIGLLLLFIQKLTDILRDITFRGDGSGWWFWFISFFLFDGPPHFVKYKYKPPLIDSKYSNQINTLLIFLCLISPKIRLLLMICLGHVYKSYAVSLSVLVDLLLIVLLLDILASSYCY